MPQGSGLRQPRRARSRLRRHARPGTPGHRPLARRRKTGTNLKTGLPVREMATVRDARLWISLDCEHLWED
ncbi:MAG: hypothetical protein N2690_02745 [Rhodocyclaceae bacterium]|nr:hypothetical protein [Rhodocyclaceae bacterium]